MRAARTVETSGNLIVILSLLSMKGACNALYAAQLNARTLFAPSLIPLLIVLQSFVFQVRIQAKNVLESRLAELES